MNNKGIWNKIKEFFRNLFKSKKPKLLVEKSQSEAVEKNNVNTEISKEKFFDIYNKVKNKEVSLSSLSLDELKRIDAMLDEEIKMKTKKIDRQVTEINMRNMDIKFYKEKLKGIDNN